MTDSIRARLDLALRDTHSIERELSGGGMARVFVASERALGRQVVIKTLPDEGWSASAAQRFHREILTAAKLQHANIVPVLTAGDAEGMPYFTMPLVDGATLRERITRGPVPLSEAIGILRDVARALSAAHAHNVVHRDIKPENILISAGAALVSDFGVAKALSVATQGPESSATMTAIGVSVGTPAYMSPEQVAADPSLDHRSDIYAWGVVAYELLAGQRPFAELSGTALMKAQMGSMPPDLASVAPQVPRTLTALVMRCLAKEAAQRPQSARELLSVLDLPSGETPAARAGSSRTMYAIAAVVVAIAVAAWGVFGRDRASGNEKLVAVAPFRVGGAAPEAQYLREGLGDVLVPQLSAVPDFGAASMRTVLDRWRKEAGDADTDLDDAKALSVARAVDAGQLLLGEIVGTRERLTVTARLLRASDGRELAQARVEGSADSVSTLATRLITTLLAVQDGATRDRLRAVLSAQPLALTSYITGERLYRRGRYAEAGRAFAEAWQSDTTFAIAALRVSQSNDWSVGGVGGIPGPWTARAWAHRDRLSGIDSLMLISDAGLSFPEPMAPRARIRMLRELAEQSRSASLWYDYGDALLHNGGMAEEPQYLERSLAAFVRAEALDSSFAGGLEHQSYLRMILGDTAGARLVLARQAALDSTGDFYAYSDLFITGVIDGPAARARALDDFERRAPDGLLFAAAMATGGLPSQDALPDLADSLTARAFRADPELVTRPVEARLMRMHYWNRGEPSKARAIRAERGDPLALIDEVNAAVLADGDSAVGAEAVQALRAYLQGRPIEAPDETVAAARATVGLWHVSRNELEAAEQLRRDLAAVRAPADALWRAQTARVFDALLAAQIAVARRAPDALPKLQLADSLLRDAPAISRASRNSAALILAAAYEAGDRPAEAMRILWRTDNQDRAHEYVIDRFRRIARVAERLGDRELAIRQLRSFIALRANAEPGLQAEVADARAKLAQLEFQGRGR